MISPSKCPFEACKPLGGSKLCRDYFPPFFVHVLAENGIFIKFHVSAAHSKVKIDLPFRPKTKKTKHYFEEGTEKVKYGEQK